MDIPIVIFKDEHSVYGVKVPDITGVHSWGNTIEEALANAKEVIVSHVETLLELGEPVEISKTNIDALYGDPAYASGIWALVSLDLEMLDSKPERINFSVPRFVLSKIDRYAASRHETRSGLLSRAVLQLIASESKVLGRS